MICWRLLVSTLLASRRLVPFRFREELSRTGFLSAFTSPKTDFRDLFKGTCFAGPATETKMAAWNYWNIFALSCCVLIFGVLESTQRALRVKRQGSQMDPMLRVICDKADGSFAHPFSCGSYVQCFNQTYQEADCPGNMYFNTKLGYCDFRRKVKCRVVDGIVELDDPNVGPEIAIPPIDHYPLKKTGDEKEEDSSE